MSARRSTVRQVRRFSASVLLRPAALRGARAESVRVRPMRGVGSPPLAACGKSDKETDMRLKLWMLLAT